MGTRRQRRDASRAMDDAASYEAWRAAATELDALTGLDAWRADDRSDCYDATALRRQLEALRRLRGSGDVLALVAFLHESLYRHLGDLADPSLYRTAHAGTKHLVEAFLDEAATTLEWLSDAEVAGIPHEAKLAEFERAAHNFGRTALLLSGGATMGFIHLGVAQALFQADLLPDVISGASTGAMIAAGICARTDPELTVLFGEPDRLRLDGLLPVGLRRGWAQRAALDPARLYAVLRHNIGAWTFDEAHQRSGRVLNISVSPTRMRQKPRLLTHRTAPDVLVASAALASSALPGLFPPVVLQRRGRDGVVSPYVGEERWIDGTVHGDLPIRRLSRLHNANHFIVSQTNPHVVPFLRVGDRDGVLPALAGAATSAARAQASTATRVARRVAGSGALRMLSDRAHSLISQDYSGDIDIHPPLEPRLYRKVVANPTLDDLRWLMRLGQRATWPRLAEIAAQTRISRTFARCLARLRSRDEG